MLYGFLDSALNDFDRAELSAHLQQCLDCYALNFELATMAIFSGDLMEDDVETDALWFRLMQALPELSEDSRAVRSDPLRPVRS